ncbi:MAG: metallophosphoesterase, partial [Chloroflexota bacterium]|nr:metallophosphoesterase [Chloroflexota bacterium]
PDEAPDLLSTRFSQAVAVRARREAARLEAALDALESRDTNLIIVVMHYAPTASTLGAEPMMKHWMLGNSILGRVVDRHDVTLVLHGHAHLGNYQGVTPGGTPVRNVALPVVGAPVILEVGRDRVVDRFDEHQELAVRTSAGSRDRPRFP